MIWGMTVEPRSVEIRLKYTCTQQYVVSCYFRSPTPVPATLHACREARDYLTSPTRHGHRYYQRAFQQVSEAYVTAIEGNPVVRERRQHQVQPESYMTITAVRRYVWVDFDIDLVSIGETHFGYITHSAHQLDIRRLRFASSMSEWLGKRVHEDVRKFANAEEVHVVCLGPEEYGGPRTSWVLAYRGFVEGRSWHCARNRLLFVDTWEFHDLETMEPVSFEEFRHLLE